ncbi:MAG TPA: uracil-DNA glycosylase family protein [Candidatus Saccharimonadales bacterium]|nr:uracil-DNA glycosylase family protein [Candidatus Saccharimonadales bacterium]
MSDLLDEIYQAIPNDPMNAEMSAKGYVPVYTASAKSRIVIVGQAPGRKAQESMKPWNDASGVLLRSWLGVTDEQFYNPDLFALVPMDFYYPGKGAHGDLPPRKGFAEKWHPKIFEHMPNVELIILVGAYSQKYYLGKGVGKNLTETVFAYHQYAPKFFPLVHPSPLNIGWRKNNAWFETDIVPKLRTRVVEILK